MSAAFARGSVPGATPMDRAVALAGVLAELGQTRLLWRARGKGGEAGEWRALCARETDLPGVLCGGGGGELRAEEIGLVVRVEGAEVRWEVVPGVAGSAEVIRALGALESGAGGAG